MAEDIFTLFFVVAGTAATILALMNDELNKRKFVKYPIVGALLVGTIYAFIGSFIPMSNDNSKIEQGRQEAEFELQPIIKTQQAEINTAKTTIAQSTQITTTIESDNSLARARIILPRNGSEIDQVITTIEGFHESLAEEETLWLYVIAGEEYYLYPVNVFSNGSWSVSNVAVGAAGEVGHEFEIGILVADAKANGLISKRTEGIYFLPPGTTTLNEVSVIQKSSAPILIITLPAENSTVERIINISGTHENIPENTGMWLFVYASEGDRALYINEIPYVSDSGTWEIQNVAVGTETSIGAVFQIGVFITNSETTAKLRANSEALLRLPAGTLSKSEEVTLYRK